DDGSVLLLAGIGKRHALIPGGDEILTARYQDTVACNRSGVARPVAAGSRPHRSMRSTALGAARGMARSVEFPTCASRAPHGSTSTKTVKQRCVSRAII